MSNYENFIKTVNNLLLDAKKRKVINLQANKVIKQTNNIILNSKPVVSFSSCSYLGLEFDKRMEEASIKAIEKFGTQFSSSRAYLSIELYEEYENLLKNIFGNHVIVTPTTSLGHIAAIPNLVGDNDAVILDHQVHNSVQIACSLLKARKIHVEILRHNNMNKLEGRIKELTNKYDKIWYMADGIYSMYGDALKANQLEFFLNQYGKFHLYVDDAHGMSWQGKHGRGFTLSKMNLHQKMVLATSLNKSFASGGGALILPSKNQVDIIRNCAAPLVTSGPLQPANLGAGIAAAKIHLSDEIYDMQDDLMDNIKYTNLLLQKSSLPAVFNSDTPIFFIGTSLPKLAYNIIAKMKEDGHYLNLGMFPAVPMKNTGVRFTITRLHTFDQIEKMVNALEKNFHLAMNEENVGISKINHAFNIKDPNTDFSLRVIKKIESEFNLNTQHTTSIEDISQKEWDSIFKGKGNYNWAGLKLIENSFSNNSEEHNNWSFDYITIKDANNNILLSTFFTSCIAKDDMMASEETSRMIEQTRLSRPNYLTSKTLFMGSLFSEGEHLFIDYNNPSWKGALSILFEKIDELKAKHKAENIILRDFEALPEEFNGILIDNGYYKMEMPKRWINNKLEWNDDEGFLSTLSAKRRRNVRNEILKKSDNFEVKIVAEEIVSENKVNELYNLYLNVQEKGLKLNTFALPKTLFKNILLSSHWETIELYSKQTNKLTAFVFCNKNNKLYSPMLIGINYKENFELGSYRQSLYQIIKRASHLKMASVSLGFSADTEKKKIGGDAITTYSYICTDNTYNQTVIGNMTNKNTKEKML